jgi:hypothetical protein
MGSHLHTNSELRGAHSSKASSTYYLKTLLQYFYQLFNSLAELTRVLTRDGSLTMVVQDSYYKDVRIDLAAISEQMSNSLGMKLHARQDFPTRITMRWINSRSRRYRSGGDSIESVLRSNNSRLAPVRCR